jgi:hypothetical protein
MLSRYRDLLPAGQSVNRIQVDDTTILITSPPLHYGCKNSAKNIRKINIDKSKIISIGKLNL